MLRVFIGVQISENLEKPLSKLLKNFAKKHWPVKWEPVEKLHFTLVFLGRIKEENLAIVKEKVKVACEDFPAFTIKIKGLGCFPDYNQPRVIWLGLKGDLQSLAKLQKQLTSELKREGFKLTERSFVPHLTLGRIKQAKYRQKKEIGRQLKTRQDLKIADEWAVDKLVIFESKFSPEGSRYLEIESFELQKQLEKDFWQE